MPDKKIKVGVIGVGSLGQHHARIYAGLPGAELVGVYDANSQTAAAVAERNKTVAFDSLEKLAQKIEAASVAVPTTLHRDVAAVLLNAGVHLLIEKPIAATTAEAEEIVALAQEKNLILQVGHIERFNPVMKFLEESAPMPRFIEAHRLASYPPPREGLHPRGTEVSVILDLMIHDIEIILHLVNSRVKEIHAVGVPVLSPTEDIANVRLLFENGCVANITASRISSERMRKIRVFSGDSYISLDYQNQEGKMFRKDKTGIVPVEVPIEKGDQLTLELESFIGCVARHGSPVVSGDHAAEALKLAMKIISMVQKGSS